MKFSDDTALETYLEKTLAVRIDTVLSDPLLTRMYREFGGSVFRRSSVYHGLSAVLQANEIRGDCCLEIGSWNGIAAAVLSQRFKRVVSIDIVDNPLKYEIAQALGLGITFLHVPQANKSRVVQELAFDFAYLDGDHARDTASDFELVKRCGRVLFHEYWPAQPPVYELVNSLGPVTTGGVCFALWRAP